MSWTHSVRGKLYDLSKFQHPGGPIALELAKNRDADDLIRSYHPFTEEKVRAILAKYEVPGESPYPPADVYYTEDTAFSKELKQKTYEYLNSGKARIATVQRAAEYFVMFAATLVSFYFFFQGNLIALFTTPVMLWVFGVNTFHDASHFAVAHNWLVNAIFTYIHPWFSSPVTWYYQHVVGHHLYVNIRGKDPDLNHHSPLHRHAPWHRFKRLHAYQTYTYYLIIAIGASIQAWVTDAVCIRKAVYQHVVKMPVMSDLRYAAHVVGRLGSLALVFTWPFFCFSMGKAFLFALVPNMIFSALYMTVSQVGHIVSEALSPPNKDFYQHQIEHTHNYGTSSAMCFYFSGGLNMQVEHHLFPGLNHCHLRGLVPIVKSLCKKYGITYHESAGFFDALSKHMNIIQTLSVR